MSRPTHIEEEPTTLNFRGLFLRLQVKACGRRILLLVSFILHARASGVSERVSSGPRRRANRRNPNGVSLVKLSMIEYSIARR